MRVITQMTALDDLVQGWMGIGKPVALNRYSVYVHFSKVKLYFNLC